MDQKRKVKVIKISVVLLLVVSFCAGGLFLYINQNKTDNWFEDRVQMGVNDAKSEAEIQAILNQKVKEGMFNVSINTAPVFENGSVAGNLWIENIPGNLYYTKVTITLDKTDEVVLKTKIIKNNQYIANIKLDKKLKKGTYKAVAKFEVIEPDRMKKIGETKVNIVITVKK